MKRINLLIVFSLLLSFSLPAISKKDAQSMYKKGWIDFNKNGVKDIYEDPLQPVEKRVADLLSQMTVEEKTCQLATLYGYGRVLRDSLPTANWKNEIWKDEYSMYYKGGKDDGDFIILKFTAETGRFYCNFSSEDFIVE